jgi:hypothetical protein
VEGLFFHIPLREEVFRMGRALSKSVWESRRRLLEQQSHSGLSVAAFCRRQKISLATFYAWKRRFEAPMTVAKQESLRPEKTGVRTPKSASPLPSFAQLPVPMNRGGSCVEISLSDGTIVRVPAHHLEAVQLVFNALRRDGQGARIGGDDHA